MNERYPHLSPELISRITAALRVETDQVNRLRRRRWQLASEIDRIDRALNQHLLVASQNPSSQKRPGEP